MRLGGKQDVLRSLNLVRDLEGDTQLALSRPGDLRLNMSEQLRSGK